MHTCFFVDLNSRLVCIDADDLTHQLVVTNFDLEMVSFDFNLESRITYQLIHGNTNHVLCNHNGTIHRVNYESPHIVSHPTQKPSRWSLYVMVSTGGYGI